MAEAHQDTEVILFEHRYFQGDHKHVFGPDGVKDLKAGPDPEFYDKTSSIVVKGPKSWLFYPSQDFTPAAEAAKVGPGVYATTEAAHPKLKDNKIRSLKPE